MYPAPKELPPPPPPPPVFPAVESHWDLYAVPCSPAWELAWGDHAAGHSRPQGGSLWGQGRGSLAGHQWGQAHTKLLFSLWQLGLLPSQWVLIPLGSPGRCRWLCKGQSVGCGSRRVVKLYRKAVPDHPRVCKFRCNVSFPLETSSVCYGISLLLSETRCWSLVLFSSVEVYVFHFPSFCSLRWNQQQNGHMQ